LKSTSLADQIMNTILVKNDRATYNNPTENSREKRLLNNFFIDVRGINNEDNYHSGQGGKGYSTRSDVFYKTDMFVIVGMDKITKFFNGGVKSFDA